MTVRFGLQDLTNQVVITFSADAGDKLSHPIKNKARDNLGCFFAFIAASEQTLSSGSHCFQERRWGSSAKEKARR